MARRRLLHPLTGPAPDPALRRRLEEAAAGLVYSSEGDYPFEYFCIPGGVGAAGGELTAERFAALVGAPERTPVGERALDDFLARHLERSDPWDVRAQELRPRYERLEAALRESLRDVRVFRIGRVQVACYLAGRDARGNIAGLRTTAIET